MVSGYLQTYLERDLQQVECNRNLADFRRLMQVAALRIGSVVNQADLARDAELSRPTAHRYLNLLEVSYQLMRLPGVRGRTKRLIKSPRLFGSDVGLGCALAGITEPTGAHLENMVLLDLLAWRDTQLRRPELMYWRTVDGHEVDFVIEHERALLPIEVKATAKPQHRDAQHLRLFMDEYGRPRPGGRCFERFRRRTEQEIEVLLAFIETLWTLSPRPERGGRTPRELAVGRARAGPLEKRMLDLLQRLTRRVPTCAGARPWTQSFSKGISWAGTEQ